MRKSRGSQIRGTFRFIHFPRFINSENIPLHLRAFA